MATKSFLAPEIKGYKLIHHLGGGSFGQVFKAHEEATGEQVAIKFLSPAKTSLNKREGELRIMWRMDHPNVMGLLAEVRDQDDCPHAVMELMDKGSLKDLLREQVAYSGTGFREKQVRYLAKQMLRGIEHIHSHDVLHRDLKPGNVLLNKRMQLKIADFGLAREGRVQRKSCSMKPAGTVQYMAPEMIYDREVYGAADMWSFGCILAELFLGKKLAESQISIYTEPGSGRVLSMEESKANLARAMPQASAFAVDLISRLLNTQADKRPTAKEALEHPFFSLHKQVQQQEIMQVQQQDIMTVERRQAIEYRKSVQRILQERYF